MSIFVILDQYGFIGGFNTMDDANKVVEEYPDVPLAIKEYHSSTVESNEYIWFLPLSDIGPPIEVSYDREFIETKQKEYQSLFFFNKLTN